MSMVAVLVIVGLIAMAAAVTVPPHDQARQRSDRDSSTMQPLFVCRLDALTRQERTELKELHARIARGTARVTQDAEGYTFQFAAEVTLATVIAWVEKERRCCPFLRFTLDVPEEGGPLRLRLWGAAGVKAFIAAEMGIEPVSSA